MKDIICIRDMYKSFFGVIAMDGMNFTVKEGEVHCLVGENGCGKSSMIKVISGFYTYDRGQLTINGRDYRRITPTESMKEGIQVIYQDFSLFANMTIMENIMMYECVNSGKQAVNWKEIRKRAQETLDKIKFDIDLDKYVHELTTAEMQMVAICRAIAQEAKLVIMDEPTTALTTREVEKLFEVVKHLKAEGISVLFVSHKLDEVLEICDSITVMRNGRNVYELRDKNQLPTKEELIYHMTGKKFEQKAHNFTLEDGAKPIMSARGLTRAGGFEDINFDLYPGEIMGITGLLGCGREALAEALFGVIPAQSGSMQIDGKDIGILRSVQDALSQRIAYLPEDRLLKGLHLEQAIEDNAVARIIGNLAKKMGVLNIREVKETKKKVLSSLHIAGMRPRNPVKSLSGGNQQKVALLKWLASDPRILILNCPTVGVDVGAKAEIHDLVKKLAHDGLGVIVISDDIPEVMQLCNRVIIMKNGRFAEELQIQDTTLEELESTLAAENTTAEEVKM